jgi:hypothetical protein
VKLKHKRENHASSLIGEDVIVVAGGWNGRESMTSIEVFKYNKDT